jgi:hypothetical protein
VIILVVLTYSLFAANRTFSINEELLDDMRSSGDIVFRKAVGIDSNPLLLNTVDSITDSDRSVVRAYYTNLQGYALETYKAFFNYENGEYVTDTEKLEEVVNHLAYGINFTGELGADYPSLHKLVTLDDAQGTIIWPKNFEVYFDSYFPNNPEFFVIPYPFGYNERNILQYTLGYIAFLYDMVYYQIDEMPNSIVLRETIETKIDNISNLLYNKMCNYGPTSTWDPSFQPLWYSYGNGQRQDLGFITLNSLGYLRLVLGEEPDEGILSWVLNKISSTYPVDPSYNDDFSTIVGDKTDMLSYLTDNAGFFSSGIDYSSQTLKGSPEIFFSALKRSYGNSFNIWDSPKMSSWIEEIIINLGPNRTIIPWSEAWTIPLSTRLPGGMYSYYHNNTNNSEVRNKVKWFVNEYFSYTNIWPDNSLFSTFLPFGICYEPGVPSLNGQLALPIHIDNGYHTDSDFTLIGNEASSGSYFDSAFLAVNHNNSFYMERSHYQNEKGNYLFWYDNDYFIIDCGYQLRTKWGAYETTETDSTVTHDGKNFNNRCAWNRSRYAMNTVLVNPQIQDEQLYFEEFWKFEENNLQYPVFNSNIQTFDSKFSMRPSSLSFWDDYNNSNTVTDPIEKSFFLDYNTYKHLQTVNTFGTLDTSTSPNSFTEDGRYTYTRDFYKHDNGTVVILDNIKDNYRTSMNNYRNQFHINRSVSVDYYDDLFSLSRGDNIIHGAFSGLSSTIDYKFDYEGSTEFPHGVLTTTDYPTTTSPSGYSHERIRLESSDVYDETYLTVLYPEETSNIVNTTSDKSSSYYTYKIEKSSNGIDYHSITDKSWQNVWSSAEVRISTDASYSLVSYTDYNHSELDEMIIKEGDKLSINNIILFESHDSNDFEEVSVKFKTDNLISIMVKTDEICNNPKLKILRTMNNEEYTCLDVTNKYGTGHEDINGTNTNTLSAIYYDDNYFYVNYDTSELPSNALRVLRNETITLTEGNISLTNQLCWNNVTINVPANRTLFINGFIFDKRCSNVSINIEGTINLSSEIDFGTSCASIYITNNGICNIENATIKKGEEFSIFFCGDNLSVINSVFSNMRRALFINSNANIVTIQGNEFNDCLRAIESMEGAIFDIHNNTFNQCSIGIDVRTGYNNNNLDYSVSDNDFLNCSTGIKFSGNGTINQEINNCTFYTLDAGIKIDETKLTISNCEFESYRNSLDNGQNIGIDIYKGRSSYNDDTRPNYDIKSCVFINNLVGIRLNESTSRIKDCIFTETNNRGILLTNNSNAWLELDANNVFKNAEAHLAFLLSSSINNDAYLKYGHNDFYDTAINDINFQVDNSSTLLTGSLDLNGNWWGSDFGFVPEGAVWNDYIEISSLQWIDIIADYYRMDVNPNNPFFANPDNRFDIAFNCLNDNSYTQALGYFRAIIEDLNENEENNWTKSLTMIYDLSQSLNSDSNELKLFYISFRDNLPDFLSPEQQDHYTYIVNNILKNLSIDIKNYSEAEQILLDRINYPISESDAIFAQMELEYLYFIIDQGGEKGYDMKLSKLMPESMLELEEMHRNHWTDIYQIFNIEDTEMDNVIPVTLKLHQNYPNPFNPETTIQFDIAKESAVKLQIYNIRGQLVKTLVNTRLNAGKHSIVWNATNENNKKVSSGVYLYRVSSDNDNVVNKMILMK